MNNLPLKRAKTNQNNNDLIIGETQDPEAFHFKVSYLMQAIDFFMDAKSIFDKLGDYCGTLKYFEAYEHYSMAILCLLKVVNC